VSLFCRESAVSLWEFSPQSEDTQPQWHCSKQCSDQCFSGNPTYWIILQFAHTHTHIHTPFLMVPGTDTLGVFLTNKNKCNATCLMSPGTTETKHCLYIHLFSLSPLSFSFITLFLSFYLWALFPFFLAKSPTQCVCVCASVCVWAFRTQSFVPRFQKDALRKTPELGEH
jgi:hypothetical protein